MNDSKKILEGKIEIDYKWNPGTTIGRFLTSLRDKKEIIGVRCTKTSKVFLLPQKSSPFGQIKMNQFVTIQTVPRLKAGTIIYKEPWNMPENCRCPYMLAAITFDDADTELLHIIKGSIEELKSLKSGDQLRAIWKKETEGNIRDIDYFKKIEEQPLKE